MQILVEHAAFGFLLHSFSIIRVQNLTVLPIHSLSAPPH